MAASVTAHASVPLPSGRTQLAVVADTHAHPHHEALPLIRALCPSAILHAGDIGSLEVIDALADIAPTYVVRGNIDSRMAETPDHVVLDLVGEVKTRVLLTHIAVYGTGLRKDARLRAQREGAQLVVCGHSHVPLVAMDHGIGVFNPGSIGPRRFRLPITFGVMTLAEGSWSFAHINCETAETWLPTAR